MAGTHLRHFINTWKVVNSVIQTSLETPITGSKKTKSLPKGPINLLCLILAKKWVLSYHIPEGNSTMWATTEKPSRSSSGRVNKVMKRDIYKKALIRISNLTYGFILQEIIFQLCRSQAVKFFKGKKQ